MVTHPMVTQELIFVADFMLRDTLFNVIRWGGTTSPTNNYYFYTWYHAQQTIDFKQFIFCEI